MSQPPYGPESERPQDRPHDPTRPFPTYARPDQHPQQAGSQQGGPQQPGSQPLGSQPPGGSPWAAPGQPQPTYGQPQYGQPQQPAYGQPGQPQAPGQQGQYPQGYGAGYGPGQYPPAYGQAPAPYNPGYGYQGDAGTNGLATAALATGIGGFFIGLSAPVAIGLGIAALVQIKRRRQAGKGLAIAGLVIGSLVTIGYVLLFAFLFVIGSRADDNYGSPEQPVSSNSGPTQYIDELKVGDCFNDSGGAEDEVILLACTVEHDGELVAIVSPPAGAYPGDSGVDKAADRVCTPAFGTYVGKSRDDSELYLDWWSPDKTTWNHGDRRVFCAARGPDDEKLTATVKGSHR